MDQNTLYTDFWKLLDSCEDYLSCGKRTGKNQVPDFSAPAEAPAPKAEAPVVHEFPVLDPGNCADCPMAKSGRRAVPALGNPTAPLWVITDAPGVEAEKAQLPLVGDEMDSFSKWMSAIELSLPEDLYLQNLIRCRPPGNRPPFPEELGRCGRELLQRLKTHRPRAILALGPHCGAWLSGRRGEKVSAVRGSLYRWQGIPLVVSYSPDQVLSYGELKRPVWEDLKALRNILNEG